RVAESAATRDRDAAAAERLTRALVRIPSGPSPSRGERRAADALAAWAHGAGAGFRVHTRALPRDPFGRRIVLIGLAGAGERGVLFTGHLDTVGTEDFGPRRAMATDPDALARADGGARRRGWLRGRGALDMKSGLAAAAVAMARLARTPERERRGTVALLATV